MRNTRKKVKNLCIKRRKALSIRLDKFTQKYWFYQLASGNHFRMYPRHIGLHRRIFGI